MKHRLLRLNSLLKEVIAEVIQRDVRHPKVHSLISVTSVEIAKDLKHAKVYVSVIGTSQERAESVAALQSSAGFIALCASKKIVLRYFPQLTFKLDITVDQQMRIDDLLTEIQRKKPDGNNSSRHSTDR